MGNTNSTTRCTSASDSASESGDAATPPGEPIAGGDFCAEIVEIRRESPTIKSFWLDYGGQPLSFLPGQWLDLYALVDGKAEVGGYSIVSAPGARPGRLQLAIRDSSTHAVTRYLHHVAQVGDTVGITGGQGRFRYERGMGDRLVLLAGGIGVTPLLSILRHVYASAPEVAVTLIYSVSTPEDILFREELDAMSAARANIHCFYTVTQPLNRDWSGFEGRINRMLLDEVGVDCNALYYFCGPPGFVDDMARDLQLGGLAPEQLIYEKWW
ncbi:ferredoxin--NADP reductase [Acidihalobacter aeolianus]|uniref:ferredoxin--NADP reductase n=1 Tax=Acidihalobacter aeolianus TaxID=2792603 RepID=UPI0009F40CF5|nr:FAD-binding oxidoreductase [Acidihalobacter aeolianus]